MTPIERNTLAQVYRTGRLSVGGIASRIANVHYETRGTGVTFCRITLDSGFEIGAESFCASGRNFNIATGQRLAFERALQHLENLYAFAQHEARHWLNQGHRHGNTPAAAA